MKKLTTIMLVLLVTLSLFAGGAKEVQKEKYVVGITLMSLRHPFFQEMKEGMDNLAKERDDLVIRLTDADFDAGIQSNQINDFIQQKVDGIVITPCDSKALGPSVQRAIDAGIPVVTVDVAAEGANVVTHVASDNIRGGEIAAGLMLGALNGRGIKEGVVAIVDHTGVTSTAQRVEGFINIMSRELPNVTLEIFDAIGQRDRAMSVTEDAMQRFGSRLVGVFGINDDCSLGALSAVERANRLSNISIVGYDAGDESRAAIDAGKIVGNTIQLPAEMGRMGIEALLSYIKGERTDFPAFMPVPVGTYTKAGAQMAE